ncbi:hypothetical protein [Scytonema sp. NUACC26]|uniref:hypothetical protein n=1 Tax=Scytonema sp. NUACC26 TaxID=3140176 RepID=UPI0034DBDA5B
MGVQIIENGLYIDSSSPPLSPKRGQIWKERNVNGDLIKQWFWNGTYWLSTNQLIQKVGEATGAASSSNSALPHYLVIDSTSNNLFVEEFTVIGSSNAGSIYSNTDYWNCNLVGFGSMGVLEGTLISSIDTKNWTNSDTYKISTAKNINFFLQVSSASIKYRILVLSIVKNGSAPATFFLGQIKYRLARV